MKESDVIRIIGKKQLKKFHTWMRGQTIGVYPDGSTNYYEWDVKAFLDGKEPVD